MSAFCVNCILHLGPLEWKPIVSYPALVTNTQQIPSSTISCSCQSHAFILSVTLTCHESPLTRGYAIHCSVISSPYSSSSNCVTFHPSQIARHAPPVAFYALPITHHSLLITHYPTLIAHHLTPIIQRSTLNAHCSSINAQRLTPIIRCPSPSFDLSSQGDSMAALYYYWSWILSTVHI